MASVPLCYVTEKEREKIREWMATHEEKRTGAIGGRFTYEFTPTTLGVIVKVLDNISGEVLDLTDYDW